MTGDAMRDVIARMMWPRCMETVGGFCGEGCVCEKEAKDFADDLLAAPASARLALARAITPDTHAVVPVHATDAMVDAAIDRPQPDPEGLIYRAIYAAMIAAARGADAEGGK